MHVSICLNLFGLNGFGATAVHKDDAGPGPARWGPHVKTTSALPLKAWEADAGGAANGGTQMDFTGVGLRGWFMARGEDSGPSGCFLRTRMKAFVALKGCVARRVAVLRAVRLKCTLRGLAEWRPRGAFEANIPWFFCNYSACAYGSPAGS